MHTHTHTHKFRTRACRFRSLSIISLISVSSFTLFISCKKDFVEEPNILTMNSQQQIIPYVSDGSTVLGAQLPNPFTVSNMEAAKDLMDSLQITAPYSINIRTTHKYIKFYPADIEDIEALEQVDERVYFSEEPLDYERTTQGGYYRAPNLSQSQLTP